MRTKYIVKHMKLDGQIITEEFSGLDEGSKRFDEVKQEDNYYYADFEIHSIISLKSLVSGK